MKNLFETLIVSDDSLTLGALIVIGAVVLAIFGFVVKKMVTFKP